MGRLEFLTRPWFRRAICVLAVACLDTAPDDAAAQARDTVVVGMVQEPDGLFLGMGYGAAVSFAVGRLLFVNMAERDAQARLMPRWAVRIPTIKDGDWQVLPGGKMRVTYRLKKGYTWHDGKPVTALDSAFSYLMLRNPRSPASGRFILRKIDNMRVPDPSDPYTLVVQWNELYPFANMGEWTYPRHLLERAYLRDPSTLTAHSQATAPVGNGPYRFVEWVRGSHITLEAYDRFPEGTPKIRRVVFRFILDSTVLLANVIAGTVDATELNGFSMDQMAEIERRAPLVATHYRPWIAVEYIFLNLDNEWLKDKRVRHAIAHAVNREEISRQILRGKFPVAHTWLPPAHDAHHSGTKSYAYDPFRARQLLEEAGFRPGADGILRDGNGARVEMTIFSTAGLGFREQVLLVLKEQLRAVGIDLRIELRPASVLFGTIARRREFPHMALFAFTLGLSALGGVWHSSQIPTAENNFVGSNLPGWRNPANDQLVDRASEELDGARRVRLLRRQQEIWAEELPAVPMYYHLSLTTSKKTLKNVTPGLLGGLLYAPERWEWAY